MNGKKVLHRHIWKEDEKTNKPELVQEKIQSRNYIGVANILNTCFASVFNKDDNARNTSGKVL